MKSTVLFVVFCLLVASYAQLNIAMVEKTEFGKTLLEAVQVHLESKEPVEVLTKMLNDMATQLAQEQAAKDKAHLAFQKSCREDIQELEGKIAVNKAKIKDAQDRLAELRPRLAQARKDLETAEARLEKLQGQLKDLLETRAEEAAEYKKKVAEHERALVAVSEAKKLFSTLLSKKAGFLQTRQGIFTQIKSGLRTAAQEMETAGYKAIFNLLAQVAEQAPIQSDQGVVEKILDLCQKVIDNINDSSSKEKEAEQARITAFKKARGKLEGEIAETQGNIGQLKNQIESLRGQIRTNEGIVKDQEEDLSKNQKAKAARQAECDQESAVYVADRKKRTEERNTVDEVINIVNTKLATLKSYIKERIKNVA